MPYYATLADQAADQIDMAEQFLKRSEWHYSQHQRTTGMAMRKEALRKLSSAEKALGRQFDGALYEKLVKLRQRAHRAGV
jgi:hypothetical protein